MTCNVTLLSGAQRGDGAGSVPHTTLAAVGHKLLLQCDCPHPRAVLVVSVTSLSWYLRPPHRFRPSPHQPPVHGLGSNVSSLSSVLAPPAVRAGHVSSR